MTLESTRPRLKDTRAPHRHQGFSYAPESQPPAASPDDHPDILETFILLETIEGKMRFQDF